MTLSTGSRLGPYEILAPLGAGGMGEVYRARDSRLSREVAVKVLPSHLSPTPEARQRFEREARAVSQLSHPNVCALYDVGREGETEYLVMELLEGETLSQRVSRGALPIDQVMRFGAEIASALEAAHRKGIVHRDLKPGNVMLTKSGVKLLDFGLARAFEAPGAPGELTTAPTATVIKDLTAEGVIVGTVPYMAPEQLRGGEIDARTDVFALGAVLYEMATGRRAFQGADQATLISAILTSEPPAISEVRPVSPPGLDLVVRTCIAKEPADRWQSTHDVELQLRGIPASGSSARPGLAPASRARRAAWLPWAVAAALGAIAAMALLSLRTGPPAPPRAVRFSVSPPEGGGILFSAEGSSLAVSPDGSQIAYVAADSKSPSRLWLRPISSIEARPLSGTEGASSLFWSPDGRSIGFFTRDKLKRMDLAAAAAVPICDIPPGGGGKSGTWGSRGEILFTSIQGGTIFRVSASGGEPKPVITIDAARPEVRLGWPWFLPDGERYLYFVRFRNGDGNLMFVEPGKAPRVVMPIASCAQYADPGYLVFSREGTLVGQRFDWRSGRVSGEPFSIAERVRYFFSTAAGGFATSRGGTLAYQSRSNVMRLVWMDRAGHEVGTVGAPGGYLSVFLARDGRRLFFDRARPGLETYDIWSFDIERHVETPITSGRDTETAPIALPDGKTIVYSVVEGTPPRLVRRDLATGTETPITEQARSFQLASDVSPDGSTLLFRERGEKGNWDLWTAPLKTPGEASPLIQSPFVKANARFSPDGRFVAFVSIESGRPEVYVAPYPGPGEKVRVSDGGAFALRWSRSGELCYLSVDGRFISVPVKTSPALQLGAPVTLFTPSGKSWLDFDMTADGKKILAVVAEVDGDEGPLSVIVNWPAEIGKP